MRRLLVELAKRHELPTVFNQSDYAKIGGLLSYGTDIVETYRQVGIYTASILLGSKAGDLPIHYPKKIRLVINVKTARDLGVSFPASILVSADQVIE